MLYYSNKELREYKKRKINSQFGYGFYITISSKSSPFLKNIRPPLFRNCTVQSVIAAPVIGTNLILVLERDKQDIAVSAKLNTCPGNRTLTPLRMQGKCAHVIL